MKLVFDTRQLPQWLWYCTAVLAVLAVVIVLTGLSGLEPLPPDAKEVLKSQVPQETPGENQGNLAVNESQESPLVQRSRNFSVRWSAVPPLPAAPPGPPRAAALQRPAPPPPPPPPPVVKVEPVPVVKPVPPEPKKPPAPSFKALATLVVGPYDGLVWVQIPGQGGPQPFGLGEKIQEYRVEKVADGYVEVSREGFRFEVEVAVPAPRSSIEAGVEDTLSHKSSNANTADSPAAAENAIPKSKTPSAPPLNPLLRLRNSRVPRSPAAPQQ